MGVAPVLSYHYGKQDREQLKNVFSLCMHFIFLASVAVFVAAFFFGPSLVQIFSAKGTAVYEIARNGFLIFSFSFLFCGLNIFISAAFTALSNGTKPSVCGFPSRSVCLTLTFSKHSTTPSGIPPGTKLSPLWHRQYLTYHACSGNFSGAEPGEVSLCIDNSFSDCAAVLNKQSCRFFSKIL